MKLGALRAVLTGASGGIGAAMAHVLVDHGASVLLAGRSRDALAALAAELPGSHPIVAADLTTTAGRQQLTRAAAEFHPNVLVSNAGASEFALLTSQDPAGIEALLDVNLVAPIHLCRDFLGLLEPGAAPKAHIVNVGSVLGAIGHPGYAVYLAFLRQAPARHPWSRQR